MLEGRRLLALWRHGAHLVDMHAVAILCRCPVFRCLTVWVGQPWLDLACRDGQPLVRRALRSPGFFGHPLEGGQAEEETMSNTTTHTAGFKAEAVKLVIVQGLCPTRRPRSGRAYPRVR